MVFLFVSFFLCWFVVLSLLVGWLVVCMDGSLFGWFVDGFLGGGGGEGGGVCVFCGLGGGGGVSNNG